MCWRLEKEDGGGGGRRRKRTEEEVDGAVVVAVFSRWGCVVETGEEFDEGLAFRTKSLRALLACTPGRSGQSVTK